MRPAAFRAIATAFALLAVSSPGRSADLRALPEGERPRDERLAPLRTLNSTFPFQKVATPEEWTVRRAELQRRVRVATGLWPWPERTPLRAVVHGIVERPGYTVEKVFFESLPGQRSDHTGQDITAAGGRHAGVTRSVDVAIDLAVRRQRDHYGRSAFHDDGAAVLSNELRGGIDLIVAVRARHNG